MMSLVRASETGRKSGVRAGAPQWAMAITGTPGNLGLIIPEAILIQEDLPVTIFWVRTLIRAHLSLPGHDSADSEESYGCDGEKLLLF